MRGSTQYINQNGVPLTRTEFNFVRDCAAYMNLSPSMIAARPSYTEVILDAKRLLNNATNNHASHAEQVAYAAAAVKAFSNALLRSERAKVGA